MNFELSDFFLRRLTSLYWRVQPDSDKSGTLNGKTAIKSSNNIQEYINILIPLIKDLRTVFRLELDKKYPNVLIAKGLEREIK